MKRLPWSLQTRNKPGFSPPTYAFAPTKKNRHPCRFGAFWFDLSVEHQLNSELERQTTQQPNPLRVMFEQIERLIETSGLQWTFLRPGMFAANSLSWWAPQIRVGDVVRWPHLAAPTAPIDERDIAAVAVRALCEDGHAGAEYVLTGPESLSQFEQVSTIGRVIGRSLRIVEISPDEARRELLRIAPLPAVNMLLEAWAAAMGQPAHVTSTVAEITGARAKTFLQWATDNLQSFGLDRA